MIRYRPGSTRTDTLCPYSTRFRSCRRRHPRPARDRRDRGPQAQDRHLPGTRRHRRPRHELPVAAPVMARREPQADPDARTGKPGGLTETGRATVREKEGPYWYILVVLRSLKKKKKHTIH